MNPTLIDLFSGCGGVSQGFKNQGFEVLGAVEWDSIVAQTYQQNHPEVRMYPLDIRAVDPQQMMQDCKLQRGELTVLSVCAPCQPFSRQNRKPGKDERTKLALEMLRFVAVMQPKFAIMENVPGLAKGDNKEILDKLVGALHNNLGYRVIEPEVVDSVNYGVPQFRKRLILLCSRDNIALRIPDRTYFPPGEALDHQPVWQTVRDAFDGIHSLAAGQKSSTDVLHRARKHGVLNMQRLENIPLNGGSRISLPEHLQLECHKGKNGFNDVYGRLSLDRPANTLTTGCTNFTKGRFAHPTADRSITLREAARLQTFPDSYDFAGSYEQISAQIGNAVPVKLAEVFAKYYYELWRNTTDS